MIGSGKKEIYMNYVKAFAIIAMVIGHTHSPFNQVIYQYHMAMFMFVSGYFYKDYYSDHPVRFLGKRIKSLYLPFVLYNVLFIILSNILSWIGAVDNTPFVINLTTLKEFVKSMLSFNAYVNYLGGFWFVKTLFITALMFCGLSFVLKKIRLGKEWWRAILILLIYSAEWGILYNKVNLSKNFIQAPMALIIFYFGYLYNKYKTKIKLNIKYLLISVALIAINSRYNIVDMDSLNYGDPIFYILSSLSGIYINIFVADLLYRKFGNIKYLNFIGISTYNILAFHLLTKNILYNVLSHYRIYDTGWLWAVDVIIAVNVSLIIYWIYLKIKSRLKLLCIRGKI